ncbi:hypothetical protein PMAYCL1PPCAC_30366 [Pristionchus mayeri]|uniref:Uncharacterized protein n=1 Tax=Pristionchus mayeri TaxID=1317129 RepID=A0AAN5DAZ1_9BILA|nr:hypothetical protein PMAYCL1PPCAC_30366 [Pristionchus mayeri]
MGRINENCNIFRTGFRKEFLQPITVGTRVFFIGGVGIEDEATKSISRISILELRPTLFDLAAVALMRDPERKRLARRILPRKIIEGLIQRRILNEEEENEDELKMKERVENGIISTIDVSQGEASNIPAAHVGYEGEEIPAKRNRLG